VLNVAAPDTTALKPTRELLRVHHPDAELRCDLAGHASLIDTRRASQLLGFNPRHTWRTD
jgi:hypothetical protein